MKPEEVGDRTGEGVKMRRGGKQEDKERDKMEHSPRGIYGQLHATTKSCQTLKVCLRLVGSGLKSRAFLVQASVPDKTWKAFWQ